MTQWRHLFSLEVFLQRGYMVLNGLKTSSGTYGEEKLTIAKNRSTAPAATWESEERSLFKVDEAWSREMELFFGTRRSGRPGDLRFVAAGARRHVTDRADLRGRAAHVERVYDDL